MLPKKTPKADLNNKRGLFFQIGLGVALSAAIVFFMWSQPAVSVQVLDTSQGIDLVQELPPIIFDEPEAAKTPPRTITVPPDVINIVRNETKITTPSDIFDSGEWGDIVWKPAGGNKIEEITDDPVDFMIIEDKPLFRGGDAALFRQWVLKELVYPQTALDNHISGRVTVQFVIDKDGNLTKITVLQSPDRSLSDETVRILQKSEQWTPGKQRGRPVAVRYTIPFDFKLQ